MHILQLVINNVITSMLINRKIAYDRLCRNGDLSTSTCGTHSDGARWVWLLNIIHISYYIHQAGIRMIYIHMHIIPPRWCYWQYSCTAGPPAVTDTPPLTSRLTASIRPYAHYHLFLAYLTPIHIYIVYTLLICILGVQ